MILSQGTKTILSISILGLTYYSTIINHQMAFNCPHDLIAKYHSCNIRSVHDIKCKNVDHSTLKQGSVNIQREEGSETEC